MYLSGIGSINLMDQDFFKFFQDLSTPNSFTGVLDTSSNFLTLPESPSEEIPVRPLFDMIQQPDGSFNYPIEPVQGVSDNIFDMIGSQIEIAPIGVNEPIPTTLIKAEPGPVYAEAPFIPERGKEVVVDASGKDFSYESPTGTSFIPAGQYGTNASGQIVDSNGNPIYSGDSGDLDMSFIEQDQPLVQYEKPFIELKDLEYQGPPNILDSGESAGLDIGKIVLFASLAWLVGDIANLW